jgi:DNA-binding PadR family transcriptional regulator
MAAAEQENTFEARLLDAIAQAGPRGLTRTSMHELLKNEADASAIADCISRLEKERWVVTTVEATGGRPRVVTRMAV